MDWQQELARRRRDFNTDLLCVKWFYAYTIG